MMELTSTKILIYGRFGGPKDIGYIEGPGILRAQRVPEILEVPDMLRVLRVPGVLGTGTGYYFYAMLQIAINVIFGFKSFKNVSRF